MSDIQIARDSGVLEIRFNRPAKKNAITNAMYGAMADALESGADDADSRAFLFTAEGDFFTAGNDLVDFASQSSGAFEGPRHVGRFLQRMIEAGKPVVAAVQGNAVGVGVTMLLHCDLVYVAESAKLTTPFIDLGLVPENASSLTLVERLGHARAFALLGLAEPLLGPDAAAFGLANAALPGAEVEPAPAPQRKRLRRSLRNRFVSPRTSCATASASCCACRKRANSSPNVSNHRKLPQLSLRSSADVRVLAA